MTNWLHNDYVAFSLIILLTLALVTSTVWVNSLLPVPNPFYRPVQAASEPDAECVTWAEAGKWTITRCENWQAGEVCFSSSSGMLVCKFE